MQLSCLVLVCATPASASTTNTFARNALSVENCSGNCDHPFICKEI